MMLEVFLETLFSSGASAFAGLVASAAQKLMGKYKSTREWEALLINVGRFFVEREEEAAPFFDALTLALSRENLERMAKELQAADGYELKHRLMSLLIQVMGRYGIPYEIAEDYGTRLMYEILEQVKEIAPDKYGCYFLQDWREEQRQCLLELLERQKKIEQALAVFQEGRLAVSTAGEMDMELRRSTAAPSLGIAFFQVDDEKFQEELAERREEKLVYIKGRCREETVYCILNELWRREEKRPIYVVKDLTSWKKLQEMPSEGNIYIPWFCADEIVAIEHNTNIFVLDENMPAYTRAVIDLRPRTRATLQRCLCDAGMEADAAYQLLKDTHGLYIPMKKRLFQGEYLKMPAWMSGVSERVKKICLLLGKWEEAEGDKVIIETLYEGSYERFLEEILPYTAGEDPLLYRRKGRGGTGYCLASLENTWECLDISREDPLWKKFVEILLDVLAEPEKLLVYDGKEQLLAKLKGERLFYSGTIREGMLQTLLMKGCYKREEGVQPELDLLVAQILDAIRTEEQWKYIAAFWLDLCEISPRVVLARLKREFDMPTGLWGLFENQSCDFIMGKNAYIDILWGIEQFLVQKDYAWEAFRWLARLDSRNYAYPSNNPADVFSKVFCTWYQFAAIREPEDKLAAAGIVLACSPKNGWSYIYNALPGANATVVGTLVIPKYREHAEGEGVSPEHMRQVADGYVRLLLDYMEFSADRWQNMIRVTEELRKGLREEVFDRLLCETAQMPDREAAAVKKAIRDLLYRHRFYQASSWALPEEQLITYEALLDKIHTRRPEYEYGYLFCTGMDSPLLHPAPYQTEGEMENNDRATEALIKEKLEEFESRGYDMAILAELCAEDDYNPLARWLAKYWRQGEWDFETFQILLSRQPSGAMAVEYMERTVKNDSGKYGEILAAARQLGYTKEVLAAIYRAEACATEGVPLADKAEEDIKKIFWRRSLACRECNAHWSLRESRKYAKLGVFLQQLYQFYDAKLVSVPELYAYLEGIEEMPHGKADGLTGYYMEKFLSALQQAYLSDKKKCQRISQLEVFFMNLLRWEDMKCFHHMIKNFPEVLAQLVSVIFQHDHTRGEADKLDERYVHNAYSIYNKARFCPTEENGKVSKERLEQWLLQFRELLERNDQSRLFGAVVGRLFSFSPPGEDGHKPCEAVRDMIEKYGDERMRDSYCAAVYNRRGVFTPSAGRAEKEMAESFRENADYLVSRYPETARIFYQLSDTYEREAKQEREEAENGK